MRYWKVVCVIGIIACLVLPGLSYGQTAKFKIGCALPLTGVFGRDGNLVKDAYTFWAETINAKGGITVKGKKYQVELVWFDDKSDKAEAAKLVERLATIEKADLILGGFGSDSVFAASAISEKYKYPMISGGASSNKLFERGFKYYFSTLGKATEEVRGCVEIAGVLKPKPKTAAVIGSDILFTSLAAEGFKDYLKKEGIELVYFELFPLSLSDYNSLLYKVKQKNPDMLLVGSHLMVALNTMKALKEVDFMPKLVAFSYGPTVPDFVKSLGKDAEYVVAAAEWAPNLPYKDDVFGTAKESERQLQQEVRQEPRLRGSGLHRRRPRAAVGYREAGPDAPPERSGQGEDHGGAAQDGFHDGLREDKIRRRRRQPRTSARRRAGAEWEADHGLPEERGFKPGALPREAVEGEKVT